MKAQDDIRKAFYEFVGDNTFADCKIPFMALGLDLEEGQEVRMTEGRLLESIEAASAIPGIFPPVFVDGKYMVDGALNLDYLRESDMDIVIGVHTENLTYNGVGKILYQAGAKKDKGIWSKRSSILQMIHILMRTIEVARKLNEKISFLTGHPDIVIEPNTMDMGMLQFERIKEAIKFGEDAAKKQMPKLKKLIKEKSKDLKQ